MVVQTNWLLIHFNGKIIYLQKIRSTLPSGCTATHFEAFPSIKIFHQFSFFNINGTFNGIDTCNSVNDGRFGFNSKFSSEAEARCIFNLPDIKANLTKLCTKNVISEYVEKWKRNFSDQFYQPIDYEIYIKAQHISVWIIALFWKKKWITKKV